MDGGGSRRRGDERERGERRKRKKGRGKRKKGVMEGDRRGGKG